MKQKRWLDRENIRAVHEDDLQSYLAGLGLLDYIRSGTAKCSHCASPVTMDNLGGLFPAEEDIVPVCDRPSCLASLFQKEGEADDGC